MKQPTLFDAGSPVGPGPLAAPRFDICASKHGGNKESIAANLKVDKAAARKVCYEALIRRGPSTCKELSHYLDKPMHRISGRLAELKEMGLVEATSIKRNGGRVLRAVF